MRDSQEKEACWEWKVEGKSGVDMICFKEKGKRKKQSEAKDRNERKRHTHANVSMPVSTHSHPHTHHMSPNFFSHSLFVTVPICVCPLRPLVALSHARFPHDNDAIGNEAMHPFTLPFFSFVHSLRLALCEPNGVDDTIAIHPKPFLLLFSLSSNCVPADRCTNSTNTDEMLGCEHTHSSTAFGGSGMISTRACACLPKHRK